MRSIAACIALALWAPLARADDDGPSPAVAMTSAISPPDPCDAIRELEPAFPPGRSTCAVVAAARLGHARVHLYAIADPDLGDELTRRALVIDDAGTRWISPPVDISGNSKLCGAWTTPLRARARLRTLRLDTGAAVALDLRVVNRANIVDPAYCKTAGYQSWTRNVFLVCGPDGGGDWSCSVDDIGSWFGPRCIASLDERGVVTRTCISRARLGLR
jgi:hypothetical protein